MYQKPLYKPNWVASFAEAWIEMWLCQFGRQCSSVASFAEAWIEISCLKICDRIRGVASFAEAWIEIFLRIY